MLEAFGKDVEDTKVGSRAPASRVGSHHLLACSVGFDVVRRYDRPGYHDWTRRVYPVLHQHPGLADSDTSSVSQAGPYLGEDSELRSRTEVIWILPEFSR